MVISNVRCLRLRTDDISLSTSSRLRISGSRLGVVRGGISNLTGSHFSVSKYKKRKPDTATFKLSDAALFSKNPRNARTARHDTLPKLNHFTESRGPLY